MEWNHGCSRRKKKEIEIEIEIEIEAMKTEWKIHGFEMLKKGGGRGGEMG